MSLFITQCPHCHTSFRTSVSQLQSADGMVRCGACLRIFAADNNLLPSVDIRTISVPNREEEDPLDEEIESNDEQLPLSDLTPPLDEDEADSEEESIFTLDMADSLPNRVSPIITESSASWELIDDDSPDIEQTPEPQTPEALTTSTTESNETVITAEEEVTPDITESDETDDDSQARARVNNLEFNSSPSNDDSLTLDGFSAEDLDNVDLEENPIELNWQEKPRKTLGITLLSIVLIGCLALQLLWVNRNALAQNPQWRTVIETLCSPIDCGLKPLVDLRLIRSDQLAVQSHPEFSNALRVKVQFRNDATFAQPLPGLLLKFTNSRDEVLAERHFTPSEYLESELQDLAAMPAKSQLQISLDLLDPGPQALNYEISFYTIPTT
ncbi:MAG: zinc-ribbon and DUF3426 domain-containing protein [Gammaproteobacteria bacterium]